MLYADYAGIVAGMDREDNDRHCDRCRSNRPHRIRKEGGDHAFAHIEAALRTSPLIIKGAGQSCRHTIQFSYLGGFVNASADISPYIK